ncbi:MAG: mechanosensitive ion channel family protein [Bryobacteraceae bacterium]
MRDVRRAIGDYRTWVPDCSLYSFLDSWRVAGRLVRQAGRSTHFNENLAELLGRLLGAVLSLLGILVAAVVVFPAFKPGDLIAGLGITSVAIGFAFKDILQNFFAGILILWREPFRVGDQIRSGEWDGTVEDINTRSTRLKTYDGERVVLPNGDVYMRAIVVHTAYDKRRVKFTVGVGYPDSLEKAREVIHDVLARTEGVARDPGPWVYVSELAPSSVNFSVFFWTGSQQANVLAVSDRVATGIKLALDEAHIDMPFPHTVVLFHNQTGSREGDHQTDVA